MVFISWLVKNMSESSNVTIERTLFLNQIFNLSIYFWTDTQCMKWQHFNHKCHCFVGYWHMFTIKHYDTLIYFPDQNFNFSNPFLCNFDLRWQILIWSYLIDNHFTEITVHLPCFLQFCSPKLWFEILSMILSEIGATKCHFIN